MGFAPVVDRIEMSSETTDVLSADTTDILSADTTDVLSADTTDVLSAETQQMSGLQTQVHGLPKSEPARAPRRKMLQNGGLEIANGAMTTKI